MSLPWKAIIVALVFVIVLVIADRAVREDPIWTAGEWDLGDAEASDPDSRTRDQQWN